ncbi:MAG: NUDIX hydrolase [Chitinophagaceae bacterium]|nr:MAG: NUDIX hydrolase [Chitinophagaceae bacterium]
MSIIQYNNYDRLLLAVDCIIFGFDGQRIKSLLIKRGFEPEIAKWSLMGGFVNNNESVDEAAKRVFSTSFPL